MNVLLSIKPKYVEEILNGTKRYEFRKVIFKNQSIGTVYIYATSPVKQIVGTFMIGSIIEDQPNILWKRFKSESGLKDFEFFNYFNGNKNGYAIEIENVERFNSPVNPEDVIPNFSPPQSFYYIDFSINSS